MLAIDPFCLASSAPRDAFPPDHNREPSPIGSRAVATREHQSIEGFEAYIARADVAVVLLAIRWSSHSFGDIKAFCDRHGKPLVRLPAGYHPNQVALQVVSQCSGRLKPGT